MESCPSWSKEHDWKSCKSLKRLRGFESLALRHKKRVDTDRYLLFFYLQGIKMGFEGRAVQSNSPVDCCDRERPSRRSGANRIPCSPPRNDRFRQKSVVSVLFALRRSYIASQFYYASHSFIALRAALEANKIKLKPQVSISLLPRGNNIALTKVSISLNNFLQKFK